MSSGTSGTQSPPLEATGEHKPMGVSSVEGGAVEAVPDLEQRKEYFKDSSTSKAEGTEKSAKPEKLGQSLSDKLEKIE